MRKNNFLRGIKNIVIAAYAYPESLYICLETLITRIVPIPPYLLWASAKVQGNRE